MVNKDECKDDCNQKVAGFLDHLVEATKVTKMVLSDKETYDSRNYLTLLKLFNVKINGTKDIHCALRPNRPPTP